MGKMFIEGVGIVEFAGDEPTPEELEVLFQNADIGDPEAAGDPFMRSDRAIQESEAERTLTPMRMGRGGQRPVPQPRELNLNPDVTEGPVGILPREFRQRARAFVESQPGIAQFAIEAGPGATGATIGAGIGAKYGGPVGALAGGVGGGLLGETLAQETGLAPMSELNMMLTIAGPLGGQLVGQMIRGGKFAVGQALTRGLPAARVARARNLMGRAVAHYDRLGASILQNQKGGMARTSTDLFESAFRAGFRVKPAQMKKTLQGIDDVLDELRPMDEITQVKSAIAAIEQAKGVLTKDPNGISLETLVNMRTLIGGQISNATSAPGVKVRKSAQLFKNLSEDLDTIASARPVGKGSKLGRAARLAKTGIQRAKLQFAVRDIEDAVARNMILDPKISDDVILNVKGLSKWFHDVTNPKLKRAYDKNLVDALGKETVEAMRSDLKNLAKLSAASGSPAGPGSIVLRGQAAKIGRGLGGAALGFLGTGGTATGAAIGGLAFAQMPEMIVGVLTSKTGSKILEAAAKAGKGSINERAWTMAGTAAFRGMGEKREIEGARRRARMQPGSEAPSFSRSMEAPTGGRGAPAAAARRKKIDEDIERGSARPPKFSRQETTPAPEDDGEVRVESAPGRGRGARPPRRRLRDIEGEVRVE